ncbi:M48 family metallopeptidase [Ferrimonas lipolytica]|uniref:M48 family metallopeptidase n=1 Tax=Ferrimonas lipolytica TaxID=2724191 RepID=A0A6H1UET6_9GAMM|nr:M48 family metallopeptidase [Ferrimonas lipolytica]QIZ76853.1 M48 family metallopeptidase [Ferrimonas lipolytica]
MNFFAQQQQARQRTLLLMGLFTVAVIAILLLCNLLFVALALPLLNDQQISVNGATLLAQMSSESGVALSVSMLLVIASVVMIKWLGLRGGGRKVAEALGGMRIQTNTQNFKQRQLLNVVEEMALAANMAVPPVYLMEEEQGINAFAAGHTQRDAVIGITQGALDQLTRPQLQGVVAHEFSHILNGDMRLNMRLIAVLSGIIFISHAGELVLRGGAHNRKNGGQIALLGFGLMLLGLIGSFFANIIKAAVNRQREYLADAAAVQFTRDPSTIADALKVIAANSHHSFIESPNAAQSSHLFFGSYKSFNSLLASHPPIDKRIRAIEPKWDGRFAEVVLKTKRSTGRSAAKVDPKPITTQEQLAPIATIGAVLLAQLPQQVQHQAREPEQLSTLALSLITSSDDLEQGNPLKTLTMQQRLTAAQLMLPTLSELSPPQAQQLQQRLDRHFGQQQPTLANWCIFQLINHYLLTDQQQQKGSNQAEATTALLSLLAIHGSTDIAQQQRAFYRASNSLGLYQAQFCPKVSWQAAGQDLQQLRKTPPLKKQRLLLAFRRCAEQDNHINDDEQALLHCLDLLLDAPSPLDSNNNVQS